jgi:hypothetical protein
MLTTVPMKASGASGAAFGTEVTALQDPGLKELLLRGSALGGIRTPNLLIRSNVYWVTTGDSCGRCGHKMAAHIPFFEVLSAEALVATVWGTSEVWHGDGTEQRRSPAQPLPSPCPSLPAQPAQPAHCPSPDRESNSASMSN